MCNPVSYTHLIKIKNEKTSGLTYSAEIFGEAAGSAKVTFKIAYKRMDGKTATKTITKDITVADGGFYGHLEDKDITLRVKLPETSTNAVSYTHLSFLNMFLFQRPL